MSDTKQPPEQALLQIYWCGDNLKTTIMDAKISELTLILARELGCPIIQGRAMALVTQKTYSDGSTQLFCAGMSKELITIVPTQTAMHKYLREVKNVFIALDRDEDFWIAKVFTLKGGNRYVKNVPGRFLMYEEALEEGLFQGLLEGEKINKTK